MTMIIVLNKTQYKNKVLRKHYETCGWKVVLDKQVKTKEMKTTEENWEKEFEKISYEGVWCGCYEGDLGGSFPKQQKVVKKFIRSLLKQEQLKLLERVENKTRKRFPSRDETNIYARCAFDVFVRTLEEIKKGIGK